MGANWVQMMKYGCLPLYSRNLFAKYRESLETPPQEGLLLPRLLPLPLVRVAENGDKRRRGRVR